jgi:hypothetical protein
MTKAATSPISTTVGGHQLVFLGEAEHQQAHIGRPMGRPMEPLAKAEQHIDAYTRDDETRVIAHTRGGAKQAAAVAAKIIPKGTTAYQKQANEHSTLAARHEQAAGQCGADSPLYGPHTELAALHLAALRHAFKSDNGRNQAERDNSARALRHLRKTIAAAERAMKDGPAAVKPAASAQPQPTGQSMTKSAGLAPILFMRPGDLPAPMAKALPPVAVAPKRRPLDTLLREMAVAQGKPAEAFL